MRLHELEAAKGDVWRLCCTAQSRGGEGGGCLPTLGLLLTCDPCRFGALSGVLSTLCFPALQRTVGLVRTGAGAIWGQLLCLLCAIAPALASFTGVNVGDRLVLGALVWGLVLSRFWLWTFDLAVNQLIQESVEHSKLGEWRSALHGMLGAVYGSARSCVWCMATRSCLAALGPLESLWDVHSQRIMA